MIAAVIVPILRLPHGEGLDLPAYATPSAAGLDLMAAIMEPIVIISGDRALIPTGIAISLPDGYEAQVRPRSGLAIKHGVTILNSPGTIDADYRGEIKAILINLGREPFSVEPKARIAQLVVTGIARIEWALAENLPETARGSGGFGSTGLGQSGM
jgi:dUTP pyrophosphatase